MEVIYNPTENKANRKDGESKTYLDKEFLLMTENVSKGGERDVCMYRYVWENNVISKIICNLLYPVFSDFWKIVTKLK